MPEADSYFIYSFFLPINNYLCKSLQMSYTESVATTWEKKKNVLCFLDYYSLLSSFNHNISVKCSLWLLISDQKSKLLFLF